MAIDPLDSPHVSDAYDRVLACVGRVALEVGSGRLTSHWPLVGRAFDHGVLVVGQAVYGWLPDWPALDATSAVGRAAILDDTKASFSDLQDPMSWIAGHRVENSPFWRTTHEVTDALAADPEDPWFSRVAWANLYPIAPGEYKGNPEGALRHVQTTAAADSSARWWTPSPLGLSSCSRVPSSGHSSNRSVLATSNERTRRSLSWDRERVSLGSAECIPAAHSDVAGRPDGTPS